MKIALTGHTKGIGLATKELLEADGHEVVGFSRTNGYNVMRPKNIVKNALDCDVFINNAWMPDAQPRLLYLMYEEWQHQAKHIFILSSTAGDYPDFFGMWGFNSWVPYVSDKQRLDEASYNLSRLWKPGMCKVTNIRPHWVRSDAIETFMGMLKKKDLPLLEPDQVAQMVKWAVDCPKDVQMRRFDFDAGSHVG